MINSPWTLSMCCLNELQINFAECSFSLAWIFIVLFADTDLNSPGYRSSVCTRLGSHTMPLPRNHPPSAHHSFINLLWVPSMLRAEENEDWATTRIRNKCTDSLNSPTILNWIGINDSQSINMWGKELFHRHHGITDAWWSCVSACA